MAKASECLCGDSGFDISVPIQKQRNSATAPSYENGTIQFITNFSVEISSRMWWKFYISEDKDCAKPEPEYPSKIKLKFDSEVIDIFKKLKVLRSDEELKIIQEIPPLYNAIHPVKERLQSLLLSNNNEFVININPDETNTIWSDNFNIIALKPEVWNLFPIDLDGIREYISNTNPDIIITTERQNPKSKKQETVFVIKGCQKRKLVQNQPVTKIEYDAGDEMEWSDSTLAYTAIEESSSTTKSEIGPPKTGLDMAYKDGGTGNASWRLHLWRTCALQTPGYDRFKCSGQDEIINKCIEQLKTIKTSLQNNDKYLCNLFKLAEQNPDGLLPCRISFYDKNDIEMFSTRPGGADYKTYFRIIFEKIDAPGFNLPESPLTSTNIAIQLFIEDDNSPEAEITNPEYVKLKFPTTLSLQDIDDDGISDELIEVETVVLNPFGVKPNFNSYFIENNYLTKLFPACSKETNKYPDRNSLLDKNRKNKKVADILDDFLTTAINGIICDNSLNPVVYYNTDLKKFSSYFGESTHTFYMNVKEQELGPYKVVRISEQNNVSDDVFDENAGELKIYNKVTKEVIDCTEGESIDFDKINIDLLKNTFHEDIGYDSVQDFFENNKNNINELIGKASLIVPIKILLEDKKAESFSFQIPNLHFTLKIDLPYKSKLTGSDVISLPYYYGNDEPDPRVANINIKINNEIVKTNLNQIEDFNDVITINEWLLDNDNRWKSSKYQTFFPLWLESNNTNLETSYGKNFEYKSLKLEELEDFNPQLKVTRAQWTTYIPEVKNKEDDTNLPCKIKIEETISALESKYSESKEFYVEPIKNYISNILSLDNSNTVLVNRTLQNNIFYLVNQQNGMYATWVGRSLNTPVGQTVEDLNIVPMAVKNNEIITGLNVNGALLYKAYKAALDRGGDDYYNCEKVINDNAGFFTIASITLPKIPEITSIKINPGEISEQKINKILSSPTEELPFPGYINDHIISLRAILNEPSKYRETCGSKFLGTGPGNY